MVPSLWDWAILAAGGLAHRVEATGVASLLGRRDWRRIATGSTRLASHRYRVDAAGVASLLGRRDWRRIATARTIYVDY